MIKIIRYFFLFIVSVAGIASVLITITGSDILPKFIESWLSEKIYIEEITIKNKTFIDIIVWAVVIFYLVANFLLSGYLKKNENFNKVQKENSSLKKKIEGLQTTNQFLDRIIRDNKNIVEQYKVANEILKARIETEKMKIYILKK